MNIELRSSYKELFLYLWKKTYEEVKDGRLSSSLEHLREQIISAIYSKIKHYCEIAQKNDETDKRLFLSDNFNLFCQFSVECKMEDYCFQNLFAKFYDMFGEALVITWSPY